MIGASRTPGTIGHELFRKLVAGEFTGPVYPVNPHTVSIASVRAYPSVLEVPDAVDLAVVVVPAPEVADVVEQCRSGNRSVILLAGHLCNWEWLLLAAGANLGIPVDVVYKPLRLADVDAYVLGARRRFGANPIPHKSFLYEVMRRNEEPRAYAMLADQTPLKRTPKHWIRFLNRDTAFFLGPERIARYVDANVVYVAMRRVRRGYYDVHLHVIAEPPYGDDAGREIAESYARHLEATIRESPADWLWIHNKWKYPKPADADANGGAARPARRA